jgi:hypothetical protein
VKRFAVVARLRPGAEGEAAALIAAGPPFDPGAVGIGRHAVYLSYGEAVFVFEGEEIDAIVGELVDDPFRSPIFDRWKELLDGHPRLAREVYFWEPAAGAGGTEP